MFANTSPPKAFCNDIDEASKIFGAQLAFGNNCMRVVLKSGGFTLFVAIMHERFS